MKKRMNRGLAVILVAMMIISIAPMSEITNTGWFDQLIAKADFEIPIDAMNFNGHSYKVFYDSETWTDANNYCNSIGGHLVTITSKEEQEFINSILNNTEKKGCWIGGYLEDDKYNWVTNEAMSYDNWETGEPNNYLHRNESCMIILLDTMTWYDFLDGGDPTGVGIGQILFVCEWDNIREHFPEGYDFKEDSYDFTNFGTSLGNEYFETLYGEGKGFSLWKNYAYTSGVCFGMAYTTAALINGMPECDSVRRLKLKQHPSELFSSGSTVKIGNKTIGLKDYIIYDFIYQFSEEFDMASTWTDIDTIFNVVKTYLYNDQIGVTIGMTRKDNSGGHRVLAVGIDGNDILIDDPNNKDHWERIIVDENGDWSFTGLNGWNSSTCNLRYSTDYNTPYQCLSTGKTVTPDADGRDTYIDGMNLLSQDSLLFTANCSSCDFSSSEYTPIYVDAVNEGNSQGKQYWIKDTDTITVSNIVGDNNSFSLSGNEAVISASTQDASEITLTVNEETDNVETNITAVQGNEYSVEYVFFNDNKDALQISISGVANSDMVSAVGIDDGLQVNGLNNISVEYKKNDKDKDAVSANVVDGRNVNITINSAEEKVNTDYEVVHHYEAANTVAPTCTAQGYTVYTCTSCGDSYNDNYTNALGHSFSGDTCTRCGSKCSCTCHSSGFMSFIWKIINFFYKLFRINQYCACGKAHW